MEVESLKDEMVSNKVDDAVFALSSLLVKQANLSVGIQREARTKLRTAFPPKSERISREKFLKWFDEPR